MVEVRDRVQRLREQAADRLGRLGALAADSTATLGKDARIAQHRADAALRALRGKRPPIRWRWVAAGAIVGVVAGVVLTQRWMRQALDLSDQVGGVVDRARETTHAAADAVRDSAATARAKATHPREKLPGTQAGDTTDDDSDKADQ